VPSIELNLDQVIGDLETLGEDLAGKAMARALNRTATTVRTTAVRWTRLNLNIKTGDVNKLIKQRRAVVHTLGGAEATITVTAKAAPLSRFGARQTRKGVSVKVKRTGSRKVVKGAFLARLRSGHLGVFKRVGDARLPIKELFSTAVVQYLDDELILERLGNVARTRFEKAIDAEIQFRMTKRLAA
jgi:hypothetical protein